MGKKNFRMSETERAIHNRAVGIRKMTDVQICEYLDSISKPDANNAEPVSEHKAVEKFIDHLEIRVGCGNGIGKGAIIKLRKELEIAVADGAIGGAKE